MKNHNFPPTPCFISEVIQDKAIITVEGEYETVAKLLNGTVPFSVTFSDLQLIFQGHDIIQCHITRKWYKVEL